MAPPTPRSGLYLLAGAAAGSVAEICGAEFIVGRQPSANNGLPVADDEMSRDHSLFKQIAPGFYTLHDCDSKNGTWHNGEPADGRLADQNDVLRMGQTVVVVDAFNATQPADDAAETMLGRSRAIAAVRQQLRALAPTALSVLLLGETGTGKEVAARRLHHDSGRKGDFVAVNCAAFPPQLMERELFGHVRGAYTGAQVSGDGLIAAAEGGTLFLDEIGELPLELQSKLLRFIEDRRYRPVGSSRERHADLRLIAATNRPLRADVDAERFRLDLLARLEEATIALPPLRERKIDLAPLVNHFFAEVAGVHPELDADFVEALALHDWPTNVRELATTIKRIATLHRGVSRLTLSLLPEALQLPLGSRRAAKSPSTTELAQLLHKHGGNIHQVAAELRRDRAQVYRWLKRKGLDPDLFRKEPPSKD